ncbi:histone deacetylase 8 [Capsaspora owczarzaki ATCC 30864]|uniref:Histone deacetylase n=1 Tax=Capsaspora owczarzaki (strain ATCC 30864) TaxID=595528 RepID=A0A0D2UEX2_CAPO3|nr:histone deacetylase 8 [Capsaspora owczarzaki ATCC 30864]KJE93626.1 histone deacetylase 8 [Capsaspora owczarzaki ATCC 30864]|eukprot:XP_004348213.1 histone deacetylase 8 [Capsaspora owczarzaki ATCC 30864]
MAKRVADDDAAACTETNNKRIRSESETSAATAAGSDRRSVALVHSGAYIRACSRLPRMPERAILIATLMEAYGLHKHLQIVSPRLATADELMMFHTREYIEFLEQGCPEQDSDEESSDDERNDRKIGETRAQRFGLELDCPPFAGIYEYAQAVAGATLTAAELLMDSNEAHTIAINWHGGWHHGRPDCAAGFCYVNDAVLGILALRRRFDRVLYVDIDLHHGDGVERAFEHSDRVACVSLHKHAPGFYPGTGVLSDTGRGRGKGYTVNFPVADGLTDSQLAHIVQALVELAHERFQPNVIVLQCGVDTLVTDPYAAFNVTPVGVEQAVQSVLACKLPTLVLGGGGYHSPSVAKCFTSVTAHAILELEPLARSIPEHDFFEQYSPDYGLRISPSPSRPTLNTDAAIAAQLATIRGAAFQTAQ